jgi:ferrochelatase
MPHVECSSNDDGVRGIVRVMTSSTSSTAVMLSGHGTVERAEEIPGFLSNIRRGRHTPQAIVDEVTHRFQRIGGSPLRRISEEQARALEARLGLPVVAAGRLWHPYLADVLEGLVQRGVERVISLPMAPQSVHVYNAALHEVCEARRAAGKPTPRIVEVPSWGEEPALLDAFSTSIDHALLQFDDSARSSAVILLSFHSLPLRAIAAGDPYEEQVRRMCAALIARRAEPGRRVEIVFQSQGMDGGEWLGPDLSSTLRKLGGEGSRDVVIAAMGFLADHTEVLYDIDIEAQQIAKEAGVRLVRAESLNTAPGLIDALSALVQRAIASDAG